MGFVSKLFSPLAESQPEGIKTPKNDYYYIRAYSQRTLHSKFNDITPGKLKPNVFATSDDAIKHLAVGLLIGLMENYKFPSVFVYKTDRLGKTSKQVYKFDRYNFWDFQD